MSKSPYRGARCASILASLLLVASGCSSGAKGTNHGTPGTAPSEAGSTQGAAADAADDASFFSFTTPVVNVAAGDEKYVCYAQTLTEDLQIDSYTYDSVAAVHHVFFSQTIAPEPDGLSVCDVLFKTTWLPLFVAGKSNATLQDPEGAASILPKGTQLVLQMHLLNPTASAANPSVTVKMHRSTLPNPEPVGLYVFGTESLALPPHVTSTVTNYCTPVKGMTSFADFAHMHLLGTKLTFAQADSTGAFQQIYSRDPYDFNNQYIDQIPVTIQTGVPTRVTCTYDNTTDGTVTFGESTTDEMCFLVFFVAGQSAGLGACVQGAADAGGTASFSDATPPDANPLDAGVTADAWTQGD